MNLHTREARRNGVNLQKLRTADPPFCSVIINEQASQVIVAPSKDQELHMARNISLARDFFVRIKLSESR